MRAVVFREQGSSDVLEVVDREPGEPGAGEVRVRVVRSGVNPTDWKTRSGASAPSMAFPEIVPNQDGAGEVDAVGAGVTDLQVGDRVWIMLAGKGRPTGTAQEFTVVPADRVVPLPESASYDLGASLGVPAVTAHRALTTSEHGPTRLAPGSMTGVVVLVAGGAGAVGNAAIQLARWAGATVITTVSGPEKATLATAAGAQHVVDYKHGDAKAEIRSLAPEGVDILVEVAPTQNLPLDLAVIRSGGCVAMYANNGGDELTLRIRETFSTNARFQWIFLYTVEATALAAAAADINAAIADGAYGVGRDHGMPLHHYPLEQTAAAHAAVEASVVGKVLVDVG